MKKIFIAAPAFVALCIVAFSCTPSARTAQRKTTPIKDTTIITVTSPLKNLNDSVSYAIGVSMASFYAQQGLTELNSTLVAQAINDVLGKKTVLLSDDQVNDIITSYMTQAQEQKAKRTIEAGQTFLAQNKTRPGVKTTASGLQYEVIKDGNGPKPTAADTVTVHYVGTFTNGEEFDNSLKRGTPISFPVTGVIKGWTEGLQLMPEGSKYKLYIPYELAYGPNDYGPIPGGSVLIFEVELLKVNGKR